MSRKPRTIAEILRSPFRTPAAPETTFTVRSKACSTCVYRKGSEIDPRLLEARVADPRMDGHFVGYRICHGSRSACCRGFWNRHKNHFALGQIAQRMGFVTFVAGDDR
jgi:hypothetical protein